MPTAVQLPHDASQSQGRSQVYAMLPFESVHEPGCYLCNWNGHLLRIPEDGVNQRLFPKVSFVGLEPLYVTKISDNPFVTLTKARMIASNWDLPVNF